MFWAHNGLCQRPGQASYFQLVPLPRMHGGVSSAPSLYLPDLARRVESTTCTCTLPLTEGARWSQLAHNEVLIVKPCSSSVHQEIAKIILCTVLQRCSYFVAANTPCQTPFLCCYSVDYTGLLHTLLASEFTRLVVSEQRVN